MAVKNLNYGLGCRLGFPPYLDGLRSGCGTRSRIEAWSDRSQCSIHDATIFDCFSSGVVDPAG